MSHDVSVGQVGESVREGDQILHADTFGGPATLASKDPADVLRARQPDTPSLRVNRGQDVIWQVPYQYVRNRSPRGSRLMISHDIIAAWVSEPTCTRHLRAGIAPGSELCLVPSVAEGAASFMSRTRWRESVGLGSNWDEVEVEVPGLLGFGVHHKASASDLPGKLGQPGEHIL